MEKASTRTASRICALLEVYAPLLTAKQQQYTRMRYQQGISFSKIAAQAKVSRQSIFDTVNQAVVALEDYEEKLKLLAEPDSLARAASQASVELPGSVKPAAPESGRVFGNLSRTLTGIRNRVQHQRVIYNTDWLLRDLNELISLINKNL